MNVDAIIHHAGWVLFVWVFVNQSGVPVPVVPSLVAAGALADAVAYPGFWIVVLVALAIVAFGALRSGRRRRSRTELVKSAALVLVIAGALSGCGGAMSEVNALSVSKVNQEEDTMPVIAIVGAGPGMGLAIAKTFGARGYRVALLSRNPAKQERLVA